MHDMKWIVYNDLKSKKHSYAASLLPGTRSTAVVTTEPCQLVFCLASAEKKHRNIESNVLPVVFLQSIRKNYPTGIQPWTGSHWSDSHLTTPPSRSSNMRQRVVWQSDSPMPMQPMGPMCLSPDKRQPSHDPTVLIQSLIWNAAMALVNIVELHRPLHVAKRYKMCYIDDIDDIDMTAIMVFSNKGSGESSVFEETRLEPWWS